MGIYLLIVIGFYIYKFFFIFKIFNYIFIRIIDSRFLMMMMKLIYINDRKIGIVYIIDRNIGIS